MILYIKEKYRKHKRLVAVVGFLTFISVILTFFSFGFQIVSPPATSSQIESLNKSMEERFHATEEALYKISEVCATNCSEEMKKENIKLLSKFSVLADDFFEKAQRSIELHQFEQAKYFLETIIAMNTSLLESDRFWDQYGTSLIELARTRNQTILLVEARKAFEKAYLIGGNWQALRGLCATSQYLLDTEKAIYYCTLLGDFSKYSQLSDAWKVVGLTHLAATYWNTGNPPYQNLAVNVANRILELEPTDETAKEILFLNSLSERSVNESLNIIESLLRQNLEASKLRSSRSLLDQGTMTGRVWLLFHKQLLLFRLAVETEKKSYYIQVYNISEEILDILLAETGTEEIDIQIENTTNSDYISGEIYFNIDNFNQPSLVQKNILFHFDSETFCKIRANASITLFPEADHSLIFSKCIAIAMFSENVKIVPITPYSDI